MEEDVRMEGQQLRESSREELVTYAHMLLVGQFDDARFMEAGLEE